LNLLIIECQDSIAIKNLQIKEIHHRIKNNLQLIGSLLNIESGEENSTTIEDFLIKGQSRIQSISLIHQNLSENEFNDKVILQNYFESIMKNLSQIYQQNVEFEINTNGLTLDIDTSITLGLIITELVSNSFKHAFSKKNGGRITIEMVKNENKKHLLTLRDNGNGFVEKPTSKKAIGLELISMLVLQINGDLIRENQQGVSYNLSF